MGLFNFSPKKSKPAVKDMVWLSKLAKQNGCVKLVQQYPNAVLIAWFPETQEEYDKFLNGQHKLGVDIVLARSNQYFQAEGRTIVFLEHHPLRGKEGDFLEMRGLSQVYVLNSLDEPLFNQFGGERIVDLMRQLGMKEDEEIDHPMITKSIEQAQQKIEKMVPMEQSSNSQDEWFKRNLKA